jgi:GH24 family phage-related lysozyme (muramidase)
LPIQFFLLSLWRIIKQKDKMNKEKKTEIIGIVIFWTVMITISFFNRQSNTIDAEVNQNMIMLDSIAKRHYLFNIVKKPINKAKEIKLSKKGIEHIKEFESISLVSYRIKGENANTLGYGHKINSQDPLWLRRKWIGCTITEAEAEKILQNDIHNFVEPAIKRMFNDLEQNGIDTNNFSQGFIDGLGSLIFNCGEEGVKETQFYAQLKAGKIDVAINLVPSTKVTMNGHKLRRNNEKEMMMS